MLKSDDAGGVEIGNVWAGDLESELAIIREIVDDFPLVAMDTEFPGVAMRPLGDFKCHADNNNHVLRAKVDLLHLIQLGLTFANAAGLLPSSASGRLIVWQFNFREFDVDRDISNPDSVDLLKKSGHQFCHESVSTALPSGSRSSYVVRRRVETEPNLEQQNYIDN